MDPRDVRNMTRSKSLPFLCRPISSVCAFIILNLLLSPTLSFDGPYSLKTEDDCIDMSNKTNCECDTEDGIFNVLCPKSASNSNDAELGIVVPHDLPNMVFIYCFSMNATDYDLVPEVAIGNLKIVTMRDCPLAGHAPIASILQKLDFINIKNSDAFDENLTRNHLNELESLVVIFNKTESRTLNLTQDTFMYLKNLKILKLAADGIIMPTGLFGPLKNLEFLGLSSNSLQFLPVGIFRNLSMLKELDLRDNQLRYLNKATFESLTNLTQLDLAQNDIETLESNIFELLPNLANIDLSYNRIARLPNGLFANTKNLNEFFFRDKDFHLVSLPEGFFSNLTKLEKIHISCGLKFLPKDIFANLSNIEFISLKNNELTTLPEAVLSDQTRLQTLELNNNNLEDLPDKLFQNNGNIIVLNLSNNRLRNISRSLFSSLRDLKELYLDNNRLLIIDLELFRMNSKLATLHLQNNFIEFSVRDSNIPLTPFSYLSQLQDLNLRNNSIRTAYAAWKDLEGLHTLDLSYNKINQLDHNLLEYSPLNHLTVNLAHNEIRSIDFSNLSSILLRNNDSPLTLDTNNNPLNCDCWLLEFVKFLHGSSPYINGNIRILAKDLICNAPDNLRGRGVNTLSGMELLCPLEQEDSKKLLCPDNCKCWGRRIDDTLLVDCSNGNWSKIPKLPDLRDIGVKATELNMTNNNLMELPLGNQGGYAEVTKLIVCGNNITHLDVIRLPSNLTHLDLRYNQLQFLNESIIMFLNESRKFVSLQLSNNPWLCNCEMKPLLKYSQMSNQKITDLSQMQCAAPLTNKFFRQLQFTDICPEDGSLMILSASFLALFGFLIALTATLYYKYKIEIKIWLYAHNLCLRLVTEEDLDKDKLYDAFVSYSSFDEEFILQQLIPKLEQNTPKFRLCIHSRDWLVGESIPRQIANSVENSRRTIILLSKNFLESTWALLEFRVAHRSALTEKRTRLIVILFDDIGDKDKLDIELRAYINSNIYLEYGDPLFWEKLRYAMPHQSPKIKGLRRNQIENAINETNV